MVKSWNVNTWTWTTICVPLLTLKTKQIHVCSALSPPVNISGRKYLSDRSVNKTLIVWYEINMIVLLSRRDLFRIIYRICSALFLHAYTKIVDKSLSLLTIYAALIHCPVTYGGFIIHLSSGAGPHIFFYQGFMM